MLSDTAIRVENLSKWYRTDSGLPYHRLSETLSNWGRGWFNGLRSSPTDRSVPVDESASPDRAGFWALKDIDLEVKRGQVLGVIGQNGAGKSTLLKVLSRITEPTRGRFGIRGKAASLLEVGTGFHPELTGRENIFVSGVVLGMTKGDIRRRFDQITEFSGIEEFLDIPVKRYSTGMRVRLAFSVAAHLNPEVLFIDEVLAVGDIGFQEKCLSKLDDLGSSGRTIVFVSHNLASVSRICDRVAVLRKGEVTSLLNRPYRDLTEVYWNAAVSTSRMAAPHRWSVKDAQTDGSDIDFKGVRPINLCVTAADGSHRITTEDQTRISFTLEILEPEPGLNLGVIIYDSSGVILMYCMTKDGHPDRWPSHRRGVQTYTAVLPRRLLAEGRYLIEMIAGVYGREWYMGPASHQVAVTANIDRAPGPSPLNDVRRPGVLGLVVDWEQVEPAVIGSRDRIRQH